MRKEKITLAFLKKGDLLKVAKELSVEYQKVKDVSSGRVKDDLILATLILLDEERQKDTKAKSRKAVSKIINS